VLTTPTIREIPSSKSTLHAFEITGKVSSDDMEAMAKHMNSAFDQYDAVDMLLIFKGFEGSDASASLNAETMKAQFRSLNNVENYVVVGAPDTAETMIEAIGAILPIKPKTFDANQEAQAWASLGAQPKHERMRARP